MRSERRPPGVAPPVSEDPEVTEPLAVVPDRPGDTAHRATSTVLVSIESRLAVLVACGALLISPAVYGGACAGWIPDPMARVPGPEKIDAVLHAAARRTRGPRTGSPMGLAVLKQSSRCPNAYGQAR